MRRGVPELAAAAVRAGTTGQPLVVMPREYQRMTDDMVAFDQAVMEHGGIDLEIEVVIVHVHITPQ